MAEWILFDAGGLVVGITRPAGERPADSTMARRNAVAARPVADCTDREYEDARRAERDARSVDGKRQRTRTHNYSGGDGYKKIG